MAQSRKEIQRRADEKRRDSRDRRWTFVTYPDSMPEMPEAEAIVTECDSTGRAVQWARSPLHAADLNGDGTEKKPHWHWLLIFKTEKSFSQVREVTEKLCGTIPQIASNVHGLIRYFIHIDNPEKAQYKREDIAKSMNFGSLDQYFDGPSISAEERADFLAEMMDYCTEKKVTRLKDLYDFARAEKRESWFRVLVTSSGVAVMRVYTDGIWQEIQEKQSEMEKLKAKFKEVKNDE